MGLNMKIYEVMAPGFSSRAVKASTPYEAYLRYLELIRSEHPNFKAPHALAVWENSEEKKVRIYTNNGMYNFVIEHEAFIDLLGMGHDLLMKAFLPSKAANITGIKS